MKGNLRRIVGLTLIEVLITLAVISILAALAVPAYDRYVRNSNRTAAKTTLQELRAKQENFFVNNKSYASDITNLGYGAAGTAGDPLYINKQSQEVAQTTSVYAVTVTVAGSSYTLTAAPQNGQTEDSECGTFTLTSIGTKSASGAKGVKCW